MAQLTSRAGVIVFCTIRSSVQVLLVKYRNDKKDLYDIPRGCIESNEKPLEAAIRELYEETNVKCRPKYKAGVYEYAARSSRNGVLLHYPIYIYACVTDYTKVYPHDKKEIEKALWLPLDKAFKLITNKDLIKYITQSFIYFHKKELL